MLILGIVGKYQTLEESQEAMINDILDAFGEQQDDYYKEEIEKMKNFIGKGIYFEDDGEIGIDSYSAWWNGRGDKYDWKIFEI